MLNQEIKYLNKRELSNLLGISYSTIQRKFKNFPKVKLGESKNSRVLFPRPQIDEFITREFMDSNSAKPKS